jgi:leader peptidase (prepilin peptidase)/N-methyltransferase
MNQAWLPIMLTVFSALFGMAVGSFLNVCIDRLPAGRSIVYPPSQCDACRHRLTVRDLIPVFSYLWLRGRCRYCQTPIPRQLPAVELTTGAGFAFLYWYYGLTASLGIALVFLCLLIIIFVIDLKHQLILDRVVYPGMALALVLACFNPDLAAEIWLRPLNALAGGAAGFAIMLIIFLLLMSRGGMGFGDVKMAALLGLMTGFPTVFIALFLAMILGGITAAFLLAFRLTKRGQAVPFGPFLAVGAMLTFIWGGPMIDWYQKFLS